MPPKPTREPRRVLIVRTSAMGDIVHSFPVLNALRRALPAVRIGWAVEEVFVPLLAQHPAIDEILPLRLRDWSWRRAWTSPATWRDLARRLGALRAFQADLALDLMGNHKSGVLCVLSGAPRRLGARRQDRREPSSSCWINEPAPVAGEHAVDRALSLLRPLGIEPGAADFAAATIMADAQADRSGYWLIHPGAGWPSKRLPASRWGQVARRLHERSGAPVVVAQAKGEEALAAAVVAASDGACRLAPAESLDRFASLARGSCLVLGSDSGPLHLAHAMGVPVLMLMGPTLAARHGPYGASERALGLDLPCRGCYRRFAEEKACLASLSPDAIAERALDIMRPVRSCLLH
jgi:lipopolysaccharide heptosyltransferase I